jgi:hypothetical protein
MKNYLLFLVGAVLLASCEQEDYADPIPGVPVFSISGLRDGQPFSLAAGDGGLAQTTNVERNKYGVLEWTSNFVQANCLDCEPVFKMTINDREDMSFANSTNSTILDPGLLSFASALSDSGYTTCSFALIYPGGDNDLQNVQFHVNGSEEDVFPITLNQGINLVEADFDYDEENETPEYKITQTVYAGGHYKLSAPFRFRHEENGNDSEHLHLYFPLPQPGGLRAESWEWGNSFGSNTSLSSDINVTLDDLTFIRLHFHNDENNLDGFYEISWNEDTDVWETENSDNNGAIIIAPSIQTTWATGELNYEKIFIDYSYNGKHYTSVNPQQNATLSLISNQSYSSNDGSGLNRQVEASFSITLYEVGNPENTLELTNCKGTFGFTVPQ